MTSLPDQNGKLYAEYTSIDDQKDEEYWMNYINYTLDELTDSFSTAVYYSKSAPKTFPAKSGEKTPNKQPAINLRQTLINCY